jgi:hypothetical protein
LILQMLWKERNRLRDFEAAMKTAKADTSLLVKSLVEKYSNMLF